MGVKSIVLIIPSLLLGMILVFYSKDLSNLASPYLFSPASKSKKDILLPIGKIKKIHGKAKAIVNNKTLSLKVNSILNHYDILLLDEDSSTTFHSITGLQIQFDGPAKIIFEFWDTNNSTDNQIIYTKIVYGNFKIISSGHPGQNYIVHNGDITTSTPKNIKRTLTITRNNQFEKLPKKNDLPPLTSESSNIKTQITPNKYNHKNKQNSENTKKLIVDNTKTLSNEYIDEVIYGYAHQFQKCYKNVLRDNDKISGKIQLKISIANKGKVIATNIINSDIKNKILIKCVQSVFSRIKFKSFSGPIIIRTFPLIFE